MGGFCSPLACVFERVFLGLQFSKGGATVGSYQPTQEVSFAMDRSLEELKQELMANNDEYSRLANEHSEYKRRLEELYRQPRLTDADRIEEINLKKKKLSLKDQMERILQKHKRDSCLTQ